MSILDKDLVTTMTDDQQLWLFDELGATKDFRITKANLLKEDRIRLTQNETDIITNTNNVATNTVNISTNTTNIVSNTTAMTTFTATDSFEIQADESLHILYCNPTANMTLTITQSTGADPTNIVRVINVSTAYNVEIDSTENYIVDRAGSTEFWFSDTILRRPSGWGTVWRGTKAQIVDLDNLVGSTKYCYPYKIMALNSADQSHTADLTVTSSDENIYSGYFVATDRLYYSYDSGSGSDPAFGSENANYEIAQIWRLYP